MIPYDRLSAPQVAPAGKLTRVDTPEYVSDCVEEGIYGRDGRRNRMHTRTQRDAWVLRRSGCRGCLDLRDFGPVPLDEEHHDTPIAPSYEASLQQAELPSYDEMKVVNGDFNGQLKKERDHITRHYFHVRRDAWDQLCCERCRRYWKLERVDDAWLEEVLERELQWRFDEMF